MDYQVGLVAEWLRGLPPDQAARVLAEIQTCLNGKTKREELTALFDTQMQTLSRLGIAYNVIDDFVGQRERIIKMAESRSFAPGYVPFLPVIPFGYLGLNGLIEMIVIDGSKGRTQLSPHMFLHSVQTPSYPYFIWNVEQGKEYEGQSAIVASDQLLRAGRSILTYPEVVSVALHTGLEPNTTLDAAATNYQDILTIVSIGIHKGAAECKAVHAGTCNQYTRTPSCGGRV